jgi:hypothetical protein
MEKLSVYFIFGRETRLTGLAQLACVPLFPYYLLGWLSKKAAKIHIKYMH